MDSKESVAALVTGFSGFVICALLSLLLTGNVDWFLSAVIAINYAAISILYWRWKRRV